MMTLAVSRLTIVKVSRALWAHVDPSSAFTRNKRMGMSQPKRTYTADDLDEFPDDGNRYEVIDGELYVTPSPRLWHQSAVLELATLIRPYAKAIGLRTFAAPTDVRASQFTQVEPDLFVYPRLADVDGTTRWVVMNRLLLAVEILSGSTARVDRGRKRELYLEHGIAEYWIIDLDARVVEVWAQGTAEPLMEAAQLHWQPIREHDALVIDLVSYFREVRS